MSSNNETFYAWDATSQQMVAVEGGRDNSSYAANDSDYANGRNASGSALTDQTLSDGVSPETLELMQRLGLM